MKKTRSKNSRDTVPLKVLHMMETGEKETSLNEEVENIAVVNCQYDVAGMSQNE